MATLAEIEAEIASLKADRAKVLAQAIDGRVVSKHSSIAIRAAILVIDGVDWLLQVFGLVRSSNTTSLVAGRGQKAGADLARVRRCGDV